MSRLASAVSAAILWFIAAALAQGSQTGCTPEELNNQIRPGDPAYADAIDLAATLQRHGFTVQCVGPSKFAQFLPGQTGAALFRTTMGDFDALFRAKDQNFYDVLILERIDADLPSGGRYHYVFRDPQGRKVQDMEGQSEAFFVRSRNIFFIVWGKNTATLLTESLGDER